MRHLDWRIAVGGVGFSLIIPAAAMAAPLVTGTDATAPPHVKRFEGAGPAETASFLAYGGFTGGVRVGAGDVTGDGVADIITATGPGAPGHVKVFSGATLAEVSSFFAYTPSFTGGVFVAAGDVTGDRRADLVTGTDAGAPGHVKVFDGSSLAEVRSFFAYPAAFTGGVRVAAGDLTGDGRADLITAAGPGAGGHVKAFDGVSLAETRSFFAYGGAFTGGVFVAAGDVNGDGAADIITGTDAGTAAHVKVFSGTTLAELHSFLPFAGFTGGVRVGAGDVNGDGYADILAATGAGSGAAPATTLVRAFDGRTGEQIASFLPYGASYTAGAFVAGEAVVPEPGCAALLGALATLARRRRRC